MAKIISRTQLNAGTEIVVDTSAKTVQLVAAGNLVAKDGVTLQAVYSKLMDLWNTATYNDYDFPMYAKDVLAGEYTIGYNGFSYNGWTWYDDTTRSYIRELIVLLNTALTHCRSCPLVRTESQRNLKSVLSKQ